MSCCNCFNDFLVKCSDGIQVNAVLSSSTAYTWQIKDKFDNLYEGEAETDSDGHFQIALEDLPDGFLTPHSGDFTLTVLDSSKLPVRLKIAQEYDCITFSVKGGTAVKDTLGVAI